MVYQATIAPQSTATSVPIVVDNNTSRAVAGVDITGAAKGPTGKIVGSGRSQGTSPPVIKPGEWALAFIHFQSAAGLSTTDTMSFKVNASPAATFSFNTVAIQVTQANLSGSSITGAVQNTTGKVVTGPISVDVYCFDEASKPVYTEGGTADSSGDLAPDATDSFRVNFSGQLCPSYLVGASGHDR